MSKKIYLKLYAKALEQMMRSEIQQLYGEEAGVSCKLTHSVLSGEALTKLLEEASVSHTTSEDELDKMSEW